MKDELLNPDWIQQFKNEDMTDTYIEFMKTKEYESYISDWIFGEPTHYAILDIDEDGIDELIITGGDGMGFYNLIVFGYDRKLKEIYPISNIDSVTYREGKENYVFQYYGGLNYSQSHKALVLSELRTGSVFGGLGYFTIKIENLYQILVYGTSTIIKRTKQHMVIVNLAIVLLSMKMSIRSI